MAIHHDQQTHFPLSDALFCEEQCDFYEDDERDEEEIESPPQFPLFSPQHALFLEDEEILHLLSKERETQIELDPNLSIERQLAVDWVIRVNSHYGFANLTVILAANYLDRFVSSVELEREKPWMMQLVAVACLSLAAKVEETQVPLLLDFQVEGCKYVFEAKTIQRMELLVLSTLEWKMNPVTPLAFVDYIITRLGFKSRMHWEFFRRCDTLLLSVISDPRFVVYLPSVLASAIMLHVIQQLEPRNHVDYQNHLLCALELTWEKVKDCYQLIVKLSNAISCNRRHQNKRKYGQVSSCASSSADSNGPNDEWPIGPSATTSSSTELRPYKKKSVPSEQCTCGRSLTGVFVDVIDSAH